MALCHSAPLVLLEKRSDSLSSPIIGVTTSINLRDYETPEQAVIMLPANYAEMQLERLVEYLFCLLKEMML